MVAISSSRGSFWPRDWILISHIKSIFFTTEPMGKTIAGYKSIYTAGNNSTVCPSDTLYWWHFCTWRTCYYDQGINYSLVNYSTSTHHDHQMHLLCFRILKQVRDYILGRGNGTPLQYSCLENPMDGGAWWAAVHGVAGSPIWLSDFTFTFHSHALEKEMATHSSVLAWRIPGTGNPGGLPSTGSHRVGHDWSDLAAAAAAETIF